MLYALGQRACRASSMRLAQTSAAAAIVSRRLSATAKRHTKLTHIDDAGNAHMVDVSDKAPTQRSATARGRVLMNRDTLDLVRQDKIKKGNVLAVAQIAGIQGAKSCSQMIPLCHPLNLTKVSVSLWLTDDLPSEDDSLCCAVEIESVVRCKGETGVEMEALSAVSVAALTVFDMCKAASKTMRIDNVRVVEKLGGKSGHWKAS